jgi:SAM-dependent methyltransferase
MLTKRLLTGIATYLPFAARLGSRGSGGPASARYCYAVWLRHLIKARAGVLTRPPFAVAELGPGGSLGTGLAALLSGSREYYALDVTRQADRERDVEILDELASLFARREPIPGPDEFPELKPDLEDYEFPLHSAGLALLDETLAVQRLERIRATLRADLSADHNGVKIEYLPGWSSVDVLPASSVDMVFSQAVLEHVDDLPATYSAMYQWLRPGGVISHEIDFRSHGTASAWNGHWTYGDLTWKAVCGRRPFLLNRHPHSRHLALMEEVGFHVVVDLRTKRRSEIARHQLARRFHGLSDEDLETSDAFIQAVKAS